MIKTPYLKPFNTQGGTLYVFPSVSRDLTKTFVSNDYEFKFSHFACLNIPDIYDGFYSNDSGKGFYIKTLMGGGTITWTSDGMSKAITENLQNYVMNFETAILNGMGDNDDYDPDVLTTVSEKVFWNWMQKVGAIKFNESGTAEDSSDITRRTVQYIGNIDVMNTVEINGDAFEELYIHIPSSVGASTSVYFRTGEMTDNKNYLNTNYEGIPELIIGREEGDSNPYHGNDENNPVNISIEALLDTDERGNVYKGDIGHTIDFRDSSYDAGMGINNMNSKSLEDFEFNAILIYYDIYEKTNTTGVRRIATNLYGILFLEEVSDTGGSSISEHDPQGYIQRYPKKKETVYENGNSYALKLDLKVSTFGDADNSYNIEPLDSDNIESMSLYMKALEQLQKCIDIFYTQKQQIINLSERVATLENLVVGIDSISSLKEEIQMLYNRCNENSIVDTATLLGLIDNNSKRLNNIMNGEKDLKIQFDTDVIQAGAGIGLQKTPNKVVINSEQKYFVNTVKNESTNTIISATNPIDTEATSKKCKISLMPGENFAVVYMRNHGDSSDSFIIDIDEETNSCDWEVGQSLKILFYCNNGLLRFSNPTTTGIIIYPTNDTNDDPITILGSEFEGNNLIEVICVDKTSDGEKTFIYLIK